MKMELVPAIYIGLKQSLYTLVPAFDSLLFGCSSVLMGLHFQLDSGEKGEQEDAQTCKQACPRS